MKLIFLILLVLVIFFKNTEILPKKVCIFDIDNTLTYGKKANEKKCNLKFYNNIQPGFPKKSGSTNSIYNVINKCKNNGYGIAIATARSGKNAYNRKIKTYLNNLDPKLFNNNFFYSPKYQNTCTIVKSINKKGNKFCTNNNHGDKAAMYYNIMNHFNIKPTDWNNSIVFDDSKKHLDTANRLTFKTCQASKECNGIYCDHGCGLNTDCLNIIK